MAEIVVQIQPDLVAAYREGAIEQLCATPAFVALVRAAGVTTGQDKGRYLNVHFQTDTPKEFWPVLQQELVRLGPISVGCRERLRSAGQVGRGRRPSRIKGQIR